MGARHTARISDWSDMIGPGHQNTAPPIRPTLALSLLLVPERHVPGAIGTLNLAKWRLERGRNGANNAV